MLSIYERGVNRHTQSFALWREYLLYMDSIKAAKRYRKTMTSALRMMPTDPQLWVMAGRRAASNGDMAAARSFFMRGCRFCIKDGTLWIEYGRCEMDWLRKVDGRRKKSKPGVDPLKPEKTDAVEDEILLSESDEEDEDNETGLLLPDPPKAQAKIIDQETAQQLKSNPAMDGAIPIAIFDVTMKQPFFTPDMAEVFFTMVSSYRDISVQPRIAQHILEALDRSYPNHPSTCNCHIREPILGLDPMTVEFPRNLREVLARLKKSMESTTDREGLAGKVVVWVDEYLALDGLDDGIRTVLEHVKSTVQGS